MKKYPIFIREIAQEIASKAVILFREKGPKKLKVEQSFVDWASWEAMEQARNILASKNYLVTEMDEYGEFYIM